MEDFKAHGEWWLLDKEDKKVQGILKFSQEEGCVLILPDRLVRKEDEEAERWDLDDESNDHEIILGNIGNECITLVDVMLYAVPAKVSATSLVRKYKYASTRILRGCHFSNKEDIRFYEAEIKLSPNVLHWTRIYETIGTTLSDFAISLEKRFDQKSKKAVYLKLKAHKPLPTDEFSDAHFHCEILLTFCIAQAVTFEEIIFFSTNDPAIRIKEYYRPRPRKKGGYMHSDLTIPYANLRDRFDEVMKKWFKNREEISTIIIRNTLYGFYATPGHYDEMVGFLDIIRVAESFYTHFLKPKSGDKQPGDRLIGIIKFASIDIQQLKYKHEGNGYAWKYGIFEAAGKKIKELCEEAEGGFNENGLIGKMVFSRNRYVHGEDKGKEIFDIRTMAGAVDMYNITHALKHILIFALFKELGIELPKEESL